MPCRLKPCPFCDSRDLLVTDNKTGAWQCFCLTCFAVGPGAWSRAKARTLWNRALRQVIGPRKRPGPMDSGLRKPVQSERELRSSRKAA